MLVIDQYLLYKASPFSFQIILVYAFQYALRGILTTEYVTESSEYIGKIMSPPLITVKLYLTHTHNAYCSQLNVNQ